MSKKISEKVLCRNASKDVLANALVKIYEGANYKEVIEKICEPRKFKSEKPNT